MSQILMPMPENIAQTPCSCCSCAAGRGPAQSGPGSGGEVAVRGAVSGRPVRAALFLCLLALWAAGYSAAEPLSVWLTGDLLTLPEGSPLSNALSFFVYDTARILLLLVLTIYVIAWLRAGLRAERVRDVLAGRGRFPGCALGAAFGAVTPFCSCSSIPLFLGFTMAGIPLGATMSFLITSPLINEVAVVLLWGLIGWKFTLIYVAVGLAAGVLGGFLMDAADAQRWLQHFVLEAREGNAVSAGSRPGSLTGKLSFEDRHRFAWSEMTGIFRRVWLWVVIGVGIGACLHGFVPQEWFAEHLGDGSWWSVPAAVIVGIPLYTNATGIVPVMESLLLKGLPLGTTLAFCLSAVAASLPELLMLRQVMRARLLAYFIAVLLVLFTLTGWLFNALQPIFG